MEKKRKKKNLYRGLTFDMRDLVQDDNGHYSGFVNTAAAEGGFYAKGIPAHDLYKSDYSLNKGGKMLHDLGELKEIIDRRFRMMEAVADHIYQELSAAHENVEMSVCCARYPEDQGLTVEVRFSSSRMETDKECEARKNRSKRAIEAAAKKRDENKLRELEELRRLKKKYPNG